MNKTLFYIYISVKLKIFLKIFLGVAIGLWILLIHEKKLTSKISRQCPFKSIITGKTLVSTNQAYVSAYVHSVPLVVVSM